MIICRNNAPLIQIYNEFLKLGKKCFIRGKDLGNNLKNIVKNTKQTKLSLNCLTDGVFPRLYNDLFTQRDILIQRCGIDERDAMESQQIQNMLDIINALATLSYGINTADELIQKIDEIFPKKDTKNGIALTTIHKAKGLEANNVYIACKSLMPSKSAKQKWEITQEYNLMYVAYTRAKNILGFIDEKDFENFIINEQTTKNLKAIETLVNDIFNKKKTINFNDSEEIKKYANQIKNIQTNVSPKITIDTKPIKKINNFSDILRKKKKIKL